MDLLLCPSSLQPAATLISRTAALYDLAMSTISPIRRCFKSAQKIGGLGCLQDKVRLLSVGSWCVARICLGLGFQSQRWRISFS